MKLDTTFLREHPATRLWRAQREQCDRCLHRIDMGAMKGKREGDPLGMRCAQTPVSAIPDKPKLGRWSFDDPAFCIDARLEGAPCGPDALLFKGKHEIGRTMK